MPDPTSRFVPGRNCCTVARANRVGLIVDGEDFFRSFSLAAEQATRSITIVAWDFNSNTRLRFDDEDGVPERLGDFLNWLARRRRSLHIHILDWDYPMVFGTEREFPQLYGLGWRPHRRIQLAFDDTHPLIASHHQKIIVIDDAFAMIGGFDLTERRWDTRDHSANDPRRACNGAPYPPFHDMAMAVDGKAALALGAIVRARWLAATGSALPRAPRTPIEAKWPRGLPVRFTDIDIAVARTLPATDDRPAVTEVEALYLDMIAGARKHIYIENQYFTVGSIGEALAARLEEADGPEIVVVVRLFSHGWLEEHTMHVLRTRLVQRLRRADTHGRFHVYYPHIDGLRDGTCIDLHSKLMIVDDEILRVGSANLSNRSMGMDSECDAALEARGDARIARSIAGFRNELLAEHLDTPVADVEAAMRRHGSLSAVIDELAHGCRSLKPLEGLPDWSASVVDLARVGDPGQPVTLETLIEEFAPEAALPPLEGEVPPPDDGPPGGIASSPAVRHAAARVIAVGAVMIAFAAVWHYTPLSHWTDPDRITALAREFAHLPVAPLVILFAYTPACLLMFPRPLITLAAVVAFGPIPGFALSMSGILLAALVTYLAGLALPKETVRRVGGSRLGHITETLRRRGLIAVTALRLVPLAPFAVEGVVAAAIGIHVSTFLLGTFIGMLPGTLATTVFGHQLEAALHDPSRIDYGLIAVAVAGFATITLLVRRWLVSQLHHRLHGHAGHDKRTR
ncbi:MAG TPA: VTT domain-containing protein [Aromatoleum sp.]|uniref:VTT domain-containing protein n=1 Tax=Aromatoleum sp. TaxID=2307007 RepID=UPI002B49ED85|nr:VTT domain-containing protein [Aromatoleum sp.]HJV24659.1 VTT domain-containing protein [Aromatoleum sp.]